MPPAPLFLITPDATNSLLAIDELVTYYMLLAASYGIVVGSSIMAVVETARWVVMSQNIKGFFTPGSSMMKFYAILTYVGFPMKNLCTEPN